MDERNLPEQAGGDYTRCVSPVHSQWLLAICSRTFGSAVTGPREHLELENPHREDRKLILYGVASHRSTGIILSYPQGRKGAVCLSAAGTRVFPQGSQWVLQHAAIPFLKVHTDILGAPQVAHRTWRKREKFILILLHPGAKRDELGLKPPFSFRAILLN